jgi:hypothetical protein
MKDGFAKSGMRARLAAATVALLGLVLKLGLAWLLLAPAGGALR